MTKTILILYVMGMSNRSNQAIENLKLLAAERPDAFEWSVVDVLERPDEAEREKVFATPMLIRVSPTPRKRIVGDLRDREQVLQRLEISSLTAETIEQP